MQRHLGRMIALALALALVFSFGSVMQSEAQGGAKMNPCNPCAAKRMNPCNPCAAKMNPLTSHKVRLIAGRPSGCP
jgi:hypothetical protein